MGGGSSAPAPPPSPPTFKNPWRQVSWGTNERDLQYVKGYQPQAEEVKHLRVLLCGPVGAGKSSFVNSVGNVVRGRMTNSALASTTTSGTSFTKDYKTHRIPKEGRGNFYPLVFNDVMGLEEGTERGISVEDIKLAMKGHVKEGYKFNPVSPLTSDDHGYNSSPSPDDRAHVVVFVFSACVSEIKDSVLMKMKAVRDAASNMGIPQLAIVTKIDEASPETAESLRNTYKSKYIKKKMTDLSSALGIPLNCILPVKNYCEEISIDDNVDTLILSCLRLIIDFGDDFINQVYL
ncbi:interferon-induced protein 44 [Lates calcarifer]|uniref:Interferon-induced protein 44 n=1 Tax=Lates calcarifer TaxID=8187 RepID=A0A4W6F0N9_LATCA|nr:interferon-induced protein 44 [Lates calcarifer]